MKLISDKGTRFITTVDPSLGVIPVFSGIIGQTTPKFVGTAFFIASQDIVVTAKHVAEDVIDPITGKVNAAMGTFQSMPNNQYLPRGFRWANRSNKSDVAIVLLESITENKTGDQYVNPCIKLTTKYPKIGDKVFTFAWPKTTVAFTEKSKKVNLASGIYEGVLEEWHPIQRDSYRMPFPCWRTSMNLMGGSSGGPVFNEHGEVFAINISGFLNGPPSWIVPIDEILDLWIERFTFSDGRSTEECTIRELAEENLVELIK